MFADLLKQSWWSLLLRGIAAILFGVLALTWPGLTIVTLIILFGAFALVDGIFVVFGSLINREAYEHWWLVLLSGLISIAAGILVFVWPLLTALILLYLIAARALIVGIMDIIAAIRLRKEIEGEWMLILAGIASVLFGLIMFIWPGAGALAVIWLIAIYAIFVGLMLLILAFKVRSWRSQLEERGEQSTS